MVERRRKLFAAGGPAAGREVKTLGDGFLATFDGPARAVRCATSIAAAVRSLDLRLRAGVHTGEIEIKAGDIAGIAVQIAARVAALAQADEVLVFEHGPRPRRGLEPALR